MYKQFGRKLKLFRTLKCKILIYTSLILILSCVLINEAPIKPLRVLKVRIINRIQCYRNDLGLPTLPEVLDDEPPKGKSIFFHETSCKSTDNSRITITSRQACAVESAALLNPNFTIYLLYTSPGALKLENNRNDKIIQKLMSYNNVRLKYLNFRKYVKDTPVEDLYSDLKIETSNFAVSHASDVLRYLTLWRYGGIYLDLDVVLLRSLEGLDLNFAGRESDWSVAAGALGFSHDGNGHKWARRAVEDLKNNFNGKDWGNNGPGVITRLLENLCNKTDVKHMSSKVCQGFTVYPPEVFYPIEWRKWFFYFNPKHTTHTMNSINNSYAIHVWNKHSETQIIHLNQPNHKQVPYILIANKYCPKVLSASADYF